MQQCSGRRVFAVLLILLAAAVAEAAPPTARTYRIGWLGNGNETLAHRAVEEFQQGLRDIGYFPGRNIAVELRHADGNMGTAAPGS